MDVTSTGKIGKYRILRVLGRGGMGEVILAQDEDLGRRVAIKRPFKSAMEEGLARFQVEAKAAVLKHPNIPAVYEMGEQDGLPYIAMEFVEGEALDKIISSGRPLDLISKLSIIEQVCLALGHAHEKGIIHRDIKPANVIVQPDGVAKIIDFGIAKLQNVDVTRGLTQTQQIIGSLHYIAPERFKGEAVDGRADIFSAGVMLYLLLTGHLPFGGSEVTASYKIVNESHTSLHEHIRDYPPALDAILDQALAKNPYDRYSTAEDFAEALDEVIEGLKKSRVGVLFDDAERLATESRFAPALELLDEAIKLDPNNTQVKKLRKLLREHQERHKRAERVREYTVQADAALATGNFTDALTALREAQRLDASSVELRNRIQAIEAQKRRFEKSMSSLAEAESVRTRGDITGALRILEKALPDDPENAKLLAARAVMAKQIEAEARQREMLQLVEDARRELNAQRLPAAEQMLRAAEAIDSSHPHVDELRRDLARVKEQEERRQLLDELQRRVNDFLRADNYEAASDLLNRAIDKLPAETMLHRLKMDVDTEARKFDAKRFVDNTLVRARDLFANSPTEALSFLQSAIDDMPGEERLIAYERSLRQQADARRVEQMHADALRKAREFMEAKRFDKVIEVLESFQLEYGNQADVEHLLAFAREEQAARLRRSAAERTMAEARALLQQERFDEAIRVLDAGVQTTNDASLSRLLEETRAQQQAAVRRRELLDKRIASLRARGELDEAIQLLEEQLAEAPKSPSIQETLNTLRAEREQHQAIQRAIETSRAAGQRRDFAAGLQALQSVTQAYGESTEISQEMQRLQAERVSVAQQLVGQSIDGARAALLRSEPEGALGALKESADWVEYADAKRQADWQRIAKSAKDDLRKTPAKASNSADLLIPDAPVAKSTTKTLVLAIVGCAVIAAAGVIAFKMLPSKTAGGAPPATTSHIAVFRAQPGAVLTVDGYPPITVAANGEASVEVKPGTYKFTVTKTGYIPYQSDPIKVDPLNPDREPVNLTVAGNTGNLTVQGTPARVKLFVDDVPKGQVSAGKAIPVEVGTHTLRFTAPGFVDSEKQTVTVVLNQPVSVTYQLKEVPIPPPSVGNLEVQTQAGAHVSVDNGAMTQIANADGKATFTGLKPGAHTVNASLDGFVSAPARTVTIEGGKNAEASAQMTRIPAQIELFRADSLNVEEGQPATLSWKVNNASSVTIDPIGAVSSAGTRSVTPSQTTTYHLVADGGVNQSVTIAVHAKPKPVEAPPPAKPAPVVDSTPKAPVGPPDAFVLRPFVNASKTVYELASRSRSAAECKHVLTSPYGGALADLANSWCGSAKTFVVTESCNAPSAGTADAPTLLCEETLVITSKSGTQISPIKIRKNFHFSKSTDGNWVVSGWDLR